MNPFRAEVSIVLDRPRTLKLDLNGWCEAEKLVGRALFQERLGFQEVRAILWAALKWEDRKLTPQKAMDLVQPDKLVMVMEKVAELVAQFFPEASEDEETKATPTGEQQGPQA